MLEWEVDQITLYYNSVPLNEVDELKLDNRYARGERALSILSLRERWGRII